MCKLHAKRTLVRQMTLCVRYDTQHIFTHDQIQTGWIGEHISESHERDHRCQ